MESVASGFATDQPASRLRQSNPYNRLPDHHGYETTTDFTAQGTGIMRPTRHAKHASLSYPDPAGPMNNNNVYDHQVLDRNPSDARFGGSVTSYYDANNQPGSMSHRSNRRDRPDTHRQSQGSLAEDEQGDDIRVISQQIIDKKAFVWAFGKNKDGEIGIGSQRDAFLPRPIFGSLKDG